MNNGNYINRFSVYVRIAHWTNALCILMLLISGLPLYTDMFNWVYHIFGNPENARLIHRIFAVIFLVPTIFVIIADRKSFLSWTGQILSWKQHDFQFLKEFPKEFFGRHVDMPPQGFFNGGQKVNSLLTIATSIILICSGVLMWFKDDFPKEIVLWAYPLHDLGVGLMVAVVIGHIYLSVGSAESRPSFLGMTKGYVDKKYAEKHHKLWYDEVMAEDKKVKK